MSEFVGPFDESNASQLEQQTTEQFQAKFEGWSPAAGSPITWLNKAFSRIGAQVLDQAALLLRSAFQRFGEAVVSVPPIQAAPATASTTWKMVDTAGYTIPAGTQVSILKAGDEALGFRTAEAATVAPGAEATTIVIEAIEAGELGNGLEADPSLVDALPFVASIELTGETANGVDEEDEDAYLERLVETLQLLSLSLNVGRDFEIDARAVASVARAKCLEAFNAEKGSEGEAEALAVSVYPVDDAGAKLSSGVKLELKERQEAKVLEGVVVYVHDPTYTGIDAETKVTILPGFDPATVKAAVAARLATLLSPAGWGIPTTGDASGSGGWVNQTTVYYNEILSEIDRVGGVGRVVSLKIAEHGKPLETKDVTLKGAVSLPEAKTITVTS